ncbi:MAG: RluA family pseudouridine synthase [Bacilli bacterium]|nr:RluA family pseudouridine synthase [Bacilli bacterium]
MSLLNVIYEDNHIIVVVKPPNVLSQKDITDDMDMITMIKQYLKEKHHKPGNVYLGLLHRLDRPVGGVMVFAKTSKAASRLSADIKSHRFEKKYLAVIDGYLVKDKGIMIDYLLKEKNGNTIVSTKEKGKYAELCYRVLQRCRDENKSLVEIQIRTGRHHQIRVQFSSRGYPLCGDQRYGKQDKTQIALFSYFLKLYHPVKKEWMEFTVLPPSSSYWSLFKM